MTDLGEMRVDSVVFVDDAADTDADDAAAATFARLELGSSEALSSLVLGSTATARQVEQRGSLASDTNRLQQLEHERILRTILLHVMSWHG